MKSVPREPSCFIRTGFWILDFWTLTTSGNFLPTFRDNLTVPSTKVQESKRSLDSWTMRITGNSLPTFRDKLSVPSSRVQESKRSLDSSTIRIIGNSLPTFREKLSVQSSGFKNPKEFWIPEPWRQVVLLPWGWDRCCPGMSVRNYHYSLRNNPQKRSSQLLREGSLKWRKSWLLCLEKRKREVYFSLACRSTHRTSKFLPWYYTYITA